MRVGKETLREVFRMKRVAVLMLMVCLMLAFACASAAKVESESMTRSLGLVTETETGGRRTTAPAPEIILEMPPELESQYSRPAAPPVAITDEVGQAWASERMIVRTAEISLVVNDVAIALDQVAVLAENLGGYVVSSTRWEQEERLAGIITIRVPAEDFGDAMEALHGLAVDIAREDTSARDVTEEYVDLSADLKNLEATEEQYLRLMEKAEEVEDMLAIQRELSRTRGEIEQTKGRMQYLEQTSATSLIRVELNQAQLDIQFQASKRTVKESERVEFRADIDGGYPPYSYEWEFGDGETSHDGSPIHAYKVAGNYTVSLKVTGDRGNTDTRTRDHYIVVRPGWSPGNIARDAWNGLVTFGHVLGNIFIWVGILSPIWIVVGGGVFWQWRRRRKRDATP